MNVVEAKRYVLGNSSIDIGRFYSSGENIALGRGKLYDSIVYPIFDSDTGVFLTVEGLGYVLTHECDVDENNNRLFNTDVLICPIIPLMDVVEELKKEKTRDQLVSFLTALGERKISRLVYLPALGSQLEYGGVLYLNHISNAPASYFHEKKTRSFGVVTGYGLTIVDHSIENHLLRPKADRLAFMPQEL